MLVLAAQEQGGAKAAREIDELVSEVTGMFAGGKLSEDALDGAMQALTRAYWIAKKRTRSTRRKSTGKNRRKSKSGFWYRLFDIMVIPEGGGAMNAEQLSKVGSDLVRRCGTRDPFQIANALGIKCHGRLRKSRITQGYVLHRQKEPLHLS